MNNGVGVKVDIVDISKSKLEVTAIALFTMLANGKQYLFYTLDEIVAMNGKQLSKIYVAETNNAPGYQFIPISTEEWANIKAIMSELGKPNIQMPSTIQFTSITPNSTYNIGQAKKIAIDDNLKVNIANNQVKNAPVSAATMAPTGTTQFFDPSINNNVPAIEETGPEIPNAFAMPVPNASAMPAVGQTPQVQVQMPQVPTQQTYVSTPSIPMVQQNVSQQPNTMIQANGYISQTTMQPQAMQTIQAPQQVPQTISINITNPNKKEISQDDFIEALKTVVDYTGGDYSKLEQAVKSNQNTVTATINTTPNAQNISTTPSINISNIPVMQQTPIAQDSLGAEANLNGNYNAQQQVAVNPNTYVPGAPTFSAELPTNNINTNMQEIFNTPTQTGVVETQPFSQAPQMSVQQPQITTVTNQEKKTQPSDLNLNGILPSEPVELPTGQNGIPQSEMQQYGVLSPNTLQTDQKVA